MDSHIFLMGKTMKKIASKLAHLCRILYPNPHVDPHNDTMAGQTVAGLSFAPFFASIAVRVACPIENLNPRE